MPLTPDEVALWDKLAAAAEEVKAEDFLLRLVQEREGLQKLIAKWRKESLIEDTEGEYFLNSCADELSAVIAALADQSS